MTIRHQTVLPRAIAAVASAAAFAQPTADEAVIAGQPAPQLQTEPDSGNVHYVQGGASLEARQALQQAQPAFSVRNEFSGQGGEYVVPEKVTVSGDQGQLLSLEQVGPILMLDLPPGRYTVEARYAGQVQTKRVEVGERDLRTLTWRWDGSGGAGR